MSETPSKPPPDGFTSWLDFALEHIDDRAAWLENGCPERWSRGDIEVFAKAELKAIRSLPAPGEQEVQSENAQHEREGKTGQEAAMPRGDAQIRNLRGYRPEPAQEPIASAGASPAPSVAAGSMCCECKRVFDVRDVAYRHRSHWCCQACSHGLPDIFDGPEEWTRFNLVAKLTGAHEDVAEIARTGGVPPARISIAIQEAIRYVESLPPVPTSDAAPSGAQDSGRGENG